MDAIKEAIQTFFLDTVGREWCVFFCSMIPIIELRGAIPMGILTMNMPWWEAYLISVLGNMVPVPFILLFINRVIFWMSKCKIKFINKFAAWLMRKAEKNRGKIEKFSFWGVCFFIAIPLPVTGAWTGSLVAAVIDMKFWKAALSALCGVCIAGAIMTALSLAVQAGVSWLGFLL